MSPRPDARYLVAGTKSWNRRLYDERLATRPGEWRFVATPDQLNDALDDGPWRYAFFLHWSFIVPADVFTTIECVVFHMTEVPYGRGGSPLQNLIVRGHHDTKLSALRMSEELDAGPVYCQRALHLCGTAEEIYVRACELSIEMIDWLVSEEPAPVPQKGDVVAFRRRKPSDSRVAARMSLDQLHDLIRMLDAEGYPGAFVEADGFRFEFHRSARYDGRIVADVTITPAEGSPS
jgi:methionyl-tRNA formyltransferase